MRVRTFFATLLSLALAFSFIACEGDQGPIGATGPQGPQGPQGQTGAPGEDGGDLAQNCIDCHSNNQLIANKIYQWENSVHATGGHNDRNAANCGVCHTSQGFLEVAGTGGQAASAAIDDPLPINCYTCHKIHDTYTEDDWALTASGPVTFWVGGETVNLDNANLCINCHQARVPNPALPQPGVEGSANVTSSRYGPHHGSQGVLFTGSAAYEVAGALPYENSFHTNVVGEGCITCHMAKAVPARQAGGHTFRVETESGALNLNGCTQCHTNVAELETLVENTTTEIEGLLNQLGTKLFELGLIRENLESVIPQEMTNLEIGIVWNYQYVREDQSSGIHNYKYTKALLTNSLAALE